jgi:NTP pyrophosphatase (non-canonical NTP hydrolase)
MTDAVANFRADRPVMDRANSSDDLVFRYLQMELDELGEVLGDREKMKTELPDVAWFLITLCQNNNIDLFETLMEKASRNICKYPAGELQEGDWEEKRKQLRKDWTPMRENEFYSI